ncbi:MAG TPA: phosphodiester glycosidase family protein [Steroidobacteraceae bacterium]
MATAKLVTIISALVAGTAAIDAQASTVSLGSYAGLYQGVSEITATVDGHAAAVVRVDLTAPGIGFTTTPAYSGAANEVVKQTTGQFLTQTGAQVAIDANRYNNNDGQATPTTFSGLEVSNGVVVNPDQSGFASLLVGAGNQASIAAGGSANLTGVKYAIAGTQGTILTNGVDNAVSDNQSAARAGLGLSQNGQYLYLMEVSGATLAEESDLFSALGAWDAINLNGGGSAMLDVSNGNGGVTELNHTSEKDVGPNLGIYAAPLQPVPLPPALVLFGSGLMGLFGIGRRKSA